MLLGRSGGWQRVRKGLFAFEGVFQSAMPPSDYSSGYRVSRVLVLLLASLQGEAAAVL